MGKVRHAKGDLLDIRGSGRMICHQTNCTSTRAAGLAASIFKEYPWADSYKDRDRRELGTVDFMHGRNVNDPIVAGLNAQYYPGRSSKGDSYGDRIEAFRECLRVLYHYDCNHIYFPHGIGCGLAGGEWDHYLELIELYASHTDQRITIVKLPR